MKTTISKKFFSICFATIFTSLLFAEVELPNRDRAKDKAKFGVNDIVYIEELTLNSCSILPSIEIANRIKNGALIYPFSHSINNFYKDTTGRLPYTKGYKDDLPSEYQMSIAPLFIHLGTILAGSKPNISRAKREFDKNYKDFHQKLLSAIEKQSKEKDPKFSLRNVDFDNDMYDIIYANPIVALELFGYTEEYDKEGGLFSKNIDDRLKDLGLERNRCFFDAPIDPKKLKEFYSLSK